MNQEWLTTEEYSQITKLSTNTIRRNFRKGKIPNATKVGGRIFIIVGAEEQQEEPEGLDLKAIAETVEQIGNEHERLSKMYFKLSNLLKSKEITSQS